MPTEIRPKINTYIQVFKMKKFTRNIFAAISGLVIILLPQSTLAADESSGASSGGSSAGSAAQGAAIGGVTAGTIAAVVAIAAAAAAFLHRSSSGGSIIWR